MEASQSNLAATAAGIAALVLVGGALYFGVPTRPGNPSGATEPDVVTDAGATALELITVHVSGAVRHPGVVIVPASSRVSDVVAAAGGATPVALLGSLNLAAEIRDGDHVVVPVAADENERRTASGPPSVFELNTATAEEFEALPGVGPVLAQRIVQFRDDHGGFDTLEDLLDVPGVGEKKLAAIRDALDRP